MTLVYARLVLKIQQTLYQLILVNAHPVQLGKPLSAVNAALHVQRVSMQMVHVFNVQRIHIQLLAQLLVLHVLQAKFL